MSFDKEFVLLLFILLEDVFVKSLDWELLVAVVLLTLSSQVLLMSA